MFFDWYQGTIQDDAVTVLETLKKLGTETRVNDSIARMYHYKHGIQIHSNSGVVATVLFDGDKHPHAFATSDQAHTFAEVLREEWPDKHKVTRVDATQDFHEFGSYERLRKVCKTVAKDHKLKFPQYSDDINPKAGRTQYVGSPKSDYRCRLYEKGYQVIGDIPQVKQGKVRAEDIPTWADSTGQIVNVDSWTRIELQVRPRHDDGKILASTLTPDQVWAMSPWTLELAKKALALNLEQVYIRQKRLSDDEKAFRAMCSQYGNILERLRVDLGDWQSLGLTIGETIKEIRNDEKKMGI
mgnify:CR=1 FL=1